MTDAPEPSAGETIHRAESEGVDANHTARARIQFLVSQHDAMIGQVQFADAKAAALLALVGFLALRIEAPMQSGVTGWAAWIDFGVLAASLGAILISLLAILPRFPSGRIRRQILKRDRFSWPALSSPGYDGAAHEAFMRGAEISELIKALSESNVAVSRILMRKFRLMQIAFCLAIAAVVLAALRRLI